MKKNGLIPPHFLYFLENEGIEFTDFKSGNMNKKENIDRMIVKFPYSSRELDIQIIFDNYDYSTPPDFIILKDDNFIIDYQEIIKEWNFKESSILYKTLNKIKETYSLHLENKFLAEMSKKDNLSDYNQQYYSNNYSSIKEIYLATKLKLKNTTKYKFISQFPQ